MRIIVKKVRQGNRAPEPRKRGRAVLTIGAAALALMAARGAAAWPRAEVRPADIPFVVSGSDGMPAPAASEILPDLPPGPERGGNSLSGTGDDVTQLSARDSVTVDDELDDLLLDGEEIDSGVSASYNGKLDIPANVRLDRLDFGSDFVKPLKRGRVTSRFDYRVNPVTGRYVFHTGMDLGAASGSDIRAMKSGRVVSAKYSGGYGNVVILEHENGVRTLYAHCSKLLVTAGEKVAKGQVIARVGSTGNSTGPHLHIEFRKGGKRYDPEWVIGGIYN